MGEQEAATGSILIVVPARAGSKGIPHKNVRILDGKPLVAHALATALGVPGAIVVLTTDDAEAADIARQYGVHVVDRPEGLCGDDVTLDPVVAHAWRSAEAAFGRAFHVIATLQPTAPLLRSSTLIRAVECVQSGRLDSCVTVTDARHLYWQGQVEAAIPLYETRVNRQWLPPLWRETGGAIVTRGEILATGERLGGRVGIIPVDAAESVDIDSIDDWAVVERRLGAPRVLYRVRGNKKIGLGHAYRCIGLARRLFVPELLVAVDSDSDPAAELIRNEHFPVARVSGDDDFIEVVSRSEYDLIINDVLDTSSDYVEALKGHGRRVVVNFEDVGTGAAAADLTVNALYEFSTPAPNGRFGWRYADLRDEFLTTPPRVPGAPGRYVLITFGGSDPAGLTARAIRACARAAEALGLCDLVVVLGPANEAAGEVHDVIEERRTVFGSVVVHTEVRRMSSLMRDATFAITSNGRTVFELGALGIPMITISQNRRETHHVFGRVSGGALDLGLAAALDDAEFQAAVLSLLREPARRAQMTRQLLQYDLRAGMERVVVEMLDCYGEWRRARRAKKGDRP